MNEMHLSLLASALEKVKAWDVEPEDLVTFVEAFRKHGRGAVFEKLKQ
jgi:hypothetical protein